MNEPLAERVRPKTLKEYISQNHLVGEAGSLTHQIRKGLFLLLFFGDHQARVKPLWQISLPMKVKDLFIL